MYAVIYILCLVADPHAVNHIIPLLTPGTGTGTDTDTQESPLVNLNFWFVMIILIQVLTLLAAIIDQAGLGYVEYRRTKGTEDVLKMELNLVQAGLD